MMAGAAQEEDRLAKEIEAYRKTLLRAKGEDLKDGILLAQGIDLALGPCPADSQLKHLEVILSLLRQLTIALIEFTLEPLPRTISLINDRVAPAFQPGGHLATLALSNLENPLKAQQGRATEILSAAGKLSTLVSFPSIAASSSSSSPGETFIVPLFRHVISTGTSRKSSLAAISSMIDYVPMDTVPTMLLSRLLDDLRVTDLANPRCTLIVKLLVRASSSENEGKSVSLDHVVMSLLPYFDSDTHPPAVTINMNRYLLPALFRCDPAYVSTLLELLSSRSELFGAWVGVASLGVSLGLILIEQLPIRELDDALSHADPDVRRRAFELVTGSREQLTSRVLQLVKKSFMWNISLPGSGSRSTFSSAAYAFFVRLHQLETVTRRNARKKAKNPSANIVQADLDSILEATASFRAWFVTDYIDPSLERALRHPVFKVLLALNLLAVYMDVFGDAAEVQEEVFTLNRVEMLLACQASEFTEVRNRARKILDMASIPLPGSEDLSTLRSQTLLRSALESLNHPRRTQAEAGKAALRILFNKVGQNDDNQQKSLAFVSDIVDRLESSLVETEMDLVRGMEESPLHGTLSAIRDLIACLRLTSGESQRIWRPTFHRLFDLVRRIWGVTRTVISLTPSKSAEGEGDRGAVITEHEIARAYDALGGGEEGEEEDEGMDHTGLLSGCWRATRNAGELLATLFAQPVFHAGASQTMWTQLEIDRAGFCFLAWLHEIRHRGTFSKIAVAFAELVDVIRPVPQLRTLCEGWSQHELDTIASDQISTTRRSAALPYSILSLVSGDQISLDRTIPSLIDLARADNTSTSNVTKVHAFNVLKIVLLDAKQTKVFDRYFEKAVLTALGAFESADWNVRNVGLILFSTMVHRCLSPARGGQDYFDSRATLATRQSFSAFHAQYPQIIPYITRYLVNAKSPIATSGTTNIHSPLFPILIIIRSLRWSEGDEELQHDLFMAVWPFLSSREYQIRQVAAQALSSLFPPELAMKRSIAFLKPAESDLNATHGNLLVLHLLITNVIDWDAANGAGTGHGYSKHVWKERLTALIRAHVPGTCPIVTRAVLEITSSYLHHAKLASKSTAMLDLAVQRSEEYLSKQQASDRPQTYIPGEELKHSACVEFLLRHRSDGDTKLPLQLMQPQAAADDHLLGLGALIDHPTELSAEMLQSVLHLASSNSERSGEAVQVAALEAIADLSWPAEVLKRWTGQWGQIVVRLEQLARASCVPLKEAALPALGWAVHQYLNGPEVARRSQSLEQLSGLILEASHEDQSQPSRWSAFQALVHFRLDIFSSNNATSPPILGFIAIHRGLLRLIQDDDEEIRLGTAEIVASALGPKNGQERGGGAVYERVTEIYWEWLREHLPSLNGGEMGWLEELAIDREGAEHDIRTLEQHTSSEVLFGVEPPNIFRDPLVDSALVIDAISSASAAMSKDLEREIQFERGKIEAAVDRAVNRQCSPIDDAWEARRTLLRRLDILRQAQK